MQSFDGIALAASRSRAAIAATLMAVLVGVGVAPVPAQAQALPDFTELVERVGPAVVGIRTTERARLGRNGGSGEMDPDLLEFFRRFGLPVPNQPPQGPRRGLPDGEPQTRGVGSGFIISADGYVMTNAHVVDGADEVLVSLTDKREFKARIIGADKQTDVALVKIEAAGLPFVRAGDVGRLKVGEWVIAIGSPFGLSNSVTAGIVSAKQRDTGDFLPFIQTDVAINPGNSGGPLINMRGEVVGINSQIYSRSGGYMGISFAIPIDEAMRVVDQLRTGGRVVRGRIGVQIDDVSREVAESIGLGKATGAMVRGVEAGSPAEKGGIEAGDIITKVDGRAIERASDLRRAIGSLKPGTKASVQVFRRGAHRDLAVTIGEVEQEASAARPKASGSEAPPRAPVSTVLGLSVVDLTDAQRREIKVRGGVRVEAAEGPAARAGLREGDVILSVDNTEVTGAKQFEGLVAKLDRSRPVTLLVRRGDWVSYVVVRPGR